MLQPKTRKSLRKLDCRSGRLLVLQGSIWPKCTWNLSALGAAVWAPPAVPMNIVNKASRGVIHSESHHSTLGTTLGTLKLVQLPTLRDFVNLSRSKWPLHSNEFPSAGFAFTRKRMNRFGPKQGGARYRFILGSSCTGVNEIDAQVLFSITDFMCLRQISRDGGLRRCCSVCWFHERYHANSLAN